MYAGLAHRSEGSSTVKEKASKRSVLDCVLSAQSKEVLRGKVFTLGGLVGLLQHLQVIEERGLGLELRWLSVHATLLCRMGFLRHGGVDVK